MHGGRLWFPRCSLRADRAHAAARCVSVHPDPDHRDRSGASPGAQSRHRPGHSAGARRRAVHTWAELADGAGRRGGWFRALLPGGGALSGRHGGGRRQTGRLCRPDHRLPGHRPGITGDHPGRRSDQPIAHCHTGALATRLHPLRPVPGHRGSLCPAVGPADCRRLSGPIPRGTHERDGARAYQPHVQPCSSQSGSPSGSSVSSSYGSVIRNHSSSASSAASATSGFGSSVSSSSRSKASSQPL